MTNSRHLCFDPQRAMHDPRLYRLAGGYAFQNFFRLLCWSTANLRDPTFLSARQVEMMKLTLGFTGEKGERFSRMRAKWADAELVQVGDDGTLLITFLLDQYEDEDQEDLDGYEPGNVLPLNGNGARSPEGLQRRQRRRNYSATPEALRSRAYYERQKAQREGEMTAGREDLPSKREVFNENLTLPGQNLTPDESKPHAMPTAFPHADALNGREVSRTRVRNDNDNDSEKEDYKIISSSGIDNDNVADPKTSRPVSGETSRLSPAAMPSLGSVLGSGPPLVPPRPDKPEPPALTADMARHQRNAAVNAVLKGTGDAHKNRPLWQMLYVVCAERNLVEAVWDEAIHHLSERLRSPGNDPVRNKAAYLQDRMRANLAQHDIHLPTKAEIAASVERGEGPEWIQEQIRLSMEAGAEEPASPIPLQAIDVDDIGEIADPAAEEEYATP